MVKVTVCSAGIVFMLSLQFNRLSNFIKKGIDMLGANNNTNSLDLAKLNFQFLLTAQKRLRTDRISAKLSLGIDDESASFIENISPEEMQRLAESGVSTIQFRFNKDSLTHLSNYVTGDDLAIVQAVMGSRQ